MTNPVLKQRMVGAVVLVALMVIFLPMVLQPPESETPEVEPELIPAPPERPRAVSVPPAPIGDESPARPDETPADLPTLAGEPADVTEQEAQGADREQPATEADGDQWIVQIASFTREENAARLEDELEEVGHRVSIQSQEMDDRVLWRVVAGPFDSRTAAEGEQTRIHERLGEEGLVIRQRR